jgi:GT2 family glycosyltransferase
MIYWARGELLKPRVLFYKLLFKAVRCVLRVTTYIRCPQLFADPTALVSKLWPSLELDDPSRPVGAPLDSIRLLVIIPFRNKWYLTRQALDALVAQERMGFAITVALVDNGSDAETVTHLKQWLSAQSPIPSLQFESLRYEIPFNFSRLNNLAFQQLGGKDSFDTVLLLNNDVVMDNRNTLRIFASTAQAAQRQGLALGAVGCTLLYAQGTVQHAFVAPGVVLVGAHPLKGIRFSSSYAWFQGVHTVPAVTGALLWMSAKVFHEVGGFDEQLPTAYQDVDLCLAAIRAGYQNVTIASLTAVHHESATRKEHPSLDEAEHMYDKWGRDLIHHPQVPPALSRWSESPVLSCGEPAFPWRWLF